jgi:hypothetical protein
MYGYGILKPVKVILRREKRKNENNGGVEPIEVHYLHIWKCHNEAP